MDSVDTVSGEEQAGLEIIIWDSDKNLVRRHGCGKEVKSDPDQYLERCGQQVNKECPVTLSKVAEPHHGCIRERISLLLQGSQAAKDSNMPVQACQPDASRARDDIAPFSFQNNPGAMESRADVERPLFHKARFRVKPTSASS